ncbi:twin-arginine translocation signal domain-containing protein [Halomontanus rarus]|uniref:twin-arginine translocation signal domain-containing protein n=1 Tax=Halomontanus rarus TaxID=3034020 RepID=UPI0023E814B1|nr:twin-arginine translocation signal domain-containing protein [Halovivax sp. TS33]
MVTRRRVLQTVTAGTAAAVAGCLTEGSRSDPETGTTEDRSGDELTTETDETDETDEKDGDGNGNEDDEEGDESDGADELNATIDEDRPRAGDPFIGVTDGNEEREAVTYDQVDSIGKPVSSSRQGHTVPVQLTPEGTESYTAALEKAGALESPRDAEIVVYDGAGVHDTYSLGPDLAAEIESGEYDGEFVISFATESEAMAFVDEFADGE